MNQKQLEGLIRTTLLECLPRRWKLPIMAGYQPTKQGREDGVYFFKIAEGKRGWQSRKYKDRNDKLIMRERQWAESQYQFIALVKDDLANDRQLLASDVLDVVRSTLSGLTMVEKLIAQGVGVQRPTDILVPSFINDQDQFDFNPNFTIVFSHPRDIKQAVPFIESVTEDITIL